MTEIFPDKAVMNVAIERLEMEAVELRKENAALYEQREALILQCCLAAATLRQIADALINTQQPSKTPLKGIND